MRAKDYLIENENAIGSDIIEDIRRVLNDLYKIRNNSISTKQYYDYYLAADIRFKCRDVEKYFIRNLGEIDRHNSYMVRTQLLNIIKDDPSFGYLFFLLGREANADSGVVEYNCVPNTQEIEFYIKYTWKDIEENIAQLSDNEKLRKLIIIKAECSKSDYPQSLKNEFINKCDTEIDLIKTLSEIAIKPSNVTSELKGSYVELELFEKDFIDKIDSMCRGKQYRNINGNCVESYHIFNDPERYGYSLSILPRERKRTCYLFKKMYRLLKRTHDEKIAVGWKIQLQNALNIPRDFIEKASINDEANKEFRNLVDPFFQQYGIK